MVVVASLSQGRTAAVQCGLFTHKSVPVIFEPPCKYGYKNYSRIPFIRKLVNRLPDYPDSLARRLNLLIILQKEMALKLSIIGSNTVQCYGFWNCKSGVVERF